MVPGNSQMPIDKKNKYENKVGSPIIMLHEFVDKSTRKPPNKVHCWDSRQEAKNHQS